MGLGHFLSKATKAAGKSVNTVTKTVEHVAANTAQGAAKAAEHAASGAAAAAGKGLQSATRGIGKVGIGNVNVANAVHALTHAGVGPLSLAGASDALQSAIHNVSKIPVLGSIIGVATPIHLVDAVNHFAKGQRIDRAAMSVLSKTVKDYKDVAPYAASVVSFVPAIGPGVGAGIAAGAALADGKRWDQIAIEAAKGAIPGGNIAKAAFDAATSAAQGKSIDKIALAALPVDDKVKTAIGAGLALTKDIASGKRVDQALLARVNDALNIAGIKGQAGQAIASGANLARDIAAGKDVTHALLARVDDAAKLAGPEVAKALQIGSAIGTAKNIQDTVMKQIGSPDALNALHDLGTHAIASNPALQQGLKTLSKNPDFSKGFTTASGIMSGKNVTESQLAGVRNALSSEAKKGFDSATSYFIGKHDVNNKPLALRNPPPKKGVPSKPAGPAQAFAYFATHGLVGAGDKQKTVLVKQMVDAHPELREGAADAIRAISVDRRVVPHGKSVWENMKHWITARGA